MSLVRLPRLFFDDHWDRVAGDTQPDGSLAVMPVVVRESERFVWVERDDPGMLDLISDAKHYADPCMYQERFGGLAENRWICLAAQRLLAALA